jgi:hypothetical protein
MKRYFILVLSLVFFVPLNAQSWAKTEKKLSKNQPTIFYRPFYHGKQIIEVDVVGAWKFKIRKLESEHPRALTWDMVYPKPEANPILIRDYSGVIIKQYNTKPYSINDWDLRSVKKSEKIAVPHRYRFIDQVVDYPWKGVVETKPFNRFYEVRSETGAGFIDTLGQVVLPLIHVYIEQKDDYYILWQNDSITRFTDLNFNDLIDPVKGEIYLVDSYLLYSEQSKYGLMTFEGVIICAPIYDQIGRFSMNLAAVKLDGKFGFIDTFGFLVIPIVYDETTGFLSKTGYARVRIGEEWFDLDQDGNRVK